MSRADRREDLAALWAHKIASLGAPHVAELEAYRAAIAASHGIVPHVDPDDGGDKATILLLLETPGPRGPIPRIVSRDNPTGTARNIARLSEAAGLTRERVVLWNVVPWLIHAPGHPNRAPTRAETTAGLTLLPDFLNRLPALKGAILAGRAAGSAQAIIAASRPNIAILRMPHPSPTYVNTAPGIAAGIEAVFARAGALAACGTKT